MPIAVQQLPDDFGTTFSVFSVQPNRYFSNSTNSESENGYSSLGFVHAFIASFSVIITSEIGDKTFFIAAIMAMRHSRIIVFLGAISALVVMTVLSAFFGWIFTYIPSEYTKYFCAALFSLFGFKMIKEAYSMADGSFNQDEFEEVKSDIKKREEECDSNNLLPLYETGPNINSEANAELKKESFLKCLSRMVPKVFVNSFVMTFMAEWGDRSQLATILLSISDNLTGVILGGVIAHSFCTALAVVGGRFAAKKFSIKTVTYIGGVLFFVFAISTLFFS